MLRRVKSRFVLAPALILGSFAGGIPAATAQTAPARPAVAAPKPDPAMEAAQKAFDALPEPERKAIQNDLIWASDFTATISGSFGKRTYDGILAFERAIKSTSDGILDAGERRQLAEEARKARAAAKFAAVTDPKTGASIGVPAAALSKRETLPGGTRWSSPDGAVVLETAVAAGQAADLPAAFDRVLNFAAPGRKVTYKLLRPDFFVVTGEAGPRSFYTRYGIGPTALSGYTISYPTAQAKQVERIVIAVANSFQPIPGAAPAASGLASALIQPGAQTQTAPPPTADTLPAGLFQTGVIVAPGKVATAGLAESCPEITVNRKTARIAGVDRASGLVLLDAETGTGKPLVMTTAGQDAAGGVVIIGFGGPPTALAVSTATRLPANAAGTVRIEASLPREGGGSAVFDRNGALLGIVSAQKHLTRQVAGLVPAVSQSIVPATAMAKLSGAATGAAPAAAVQSAGAIAAAAAPSLVAVECVRPIPLPKG